MKTDLKLTESDERNLRAMPDNKWVEIDDMFPAIKRTRYSLDRLVHAGYVKREIFTNNKIHTFKYRKLFNP